MKTTQFALLISTVPAAFSQNPNGTTSQPCYWPDGSLAENSYACGSDNTVHHACCLIDGSCIDGGYCIGLYGYLNRVSCTDRSWSDPACPSQCFDTVKDGFVSLAPCDAPHGKWCCLDGSMTSGCCANNTFQFSPLGITAWRNASNTQTFFQALAVTQATVTVTNVAATSTIPAQTTSISTATPDAQNGICQAGNCNSTTTGLAVGLPLGCALLAALAWGFLEHRRSKSSKILEKSHGEPRFSSIWFPNPEPELEAPKLSQRLMERSRAAELD